MMGNVKKPYKKKLVSDPDFMFMFHGLRPYAGQIVTVTQHNGPFRTIRCADGAEFYGIGRGLLEPVKS